MVKNVLLICGGRSAEHEISIRSAKTVCASLDRSLFQPFMVAIDRSGSWYFIDNSNDLQQLDNFDDISSLFAECFLRRLNGVVYLCSDDGMRQNIDVAFPVLHGPYGEDGTIQGLFEMLGLPYVGSGVAASVNSMDKCIFKTVMRSAGIPIVPSISVKFDEKSCFSYEKVESELGSKECFVKPAFMGSSVGISKASCEKTYDEAVANAFRYSASIVIEKAVCGMEIECAILGNDPFDVTDVCQIIPSHEFYSYEAKYLDPNGAAFDYSPGITVEQKESIQEYARKVASVMGCRGLSRVDFFVLGASVDDIYVNEINTMPGFTSISMYPELWRRMGIETRDLVTKLINYGFEDHVSKSNIALSPNELIVSGGTDIFKERCA